MTTIVAVRKNNKAVIGADTLTTYGDQLEPDGLVLNSSKLIQSGDTWMGLTGHAAMDLVLRQLLAGYTADDEEPPCPTDFSSVDDIFGSFLVIHERMKRHFFMRTEEDKEDEFESMHINVLLANPAGIFGVCSKRSVFEYGRFYAYGSGEQYALGAMQSVYDALDDAEDIALAGLNAAVQFDARTGTPLELRSVALSSPSLS